VQGAQVPAGLPLRGRVAHLLRDREALLVHVDGPAELAHAFEGVAHVAEGPELPSAVAHALGNLELFLEIGYGRGEFSESVVRVSKAANRS
jgi:hypothetical protein